MGLTKSTLFTAQENRMAELAKAIGHPARVAIIRHLVVTNACICGDLVDVLRLSQSTVSQHLRALKQVGLIKGNIEGTSTCYCINQEVWEEAKLIFTQLCTSLSREESCC